jgi:hypothetical protein
MRIVNVKPAARLLALLTLGLALGASTAQAQAPALAPGEVQLKMPGGGTYVGTVTNGVPDGKGYFRDADGTQYEGEVRMGHRTGIADGVLADGNRYQGEWKDGKPHGIGKMTYMLGGVYEGEWRKGLRHGKGSMVFAGSGRRAEVRFEQGYRVDVRSGPQVVTDVVMEYTPPGGTPIGSHIPIPGKVAQAPIPFDRGWDKFTPEQKHFVRSHYPALEVGDDPPYPLRGVQGFYDELARLAGHLDLNGDVLLYVSVGADGKVTSVTTIGTLDPDIKRAIGAAAGSLKYKPATCAGQPCPGVVPFNLTLSAD